MKRRLILIFSILFLSFLSYTGKNADNASCEKEFSQSVVHNSEQSIVQGGSFIDANARPISLTTFSTSHSNTNTQSSSRRLITYFMSGAGLAIANLYAEYNYFPNCDLNSGYSPLKELYIILRNIRI